MKTLPDKIYNLHLTTGADVSFNQLYNKNTLKNRQLLQWLEEKATGWKGGQTVPPPYIEAKPNSTTSISVFIAPDKVMVAPGFYQVFYGLTIDNLKKIGKTVDEKATVFNIDGLVPGTTYYVAVRTITGPHVCNPNVLTSDMSQKNSTCTHEKPNGEFGLIVESSPNYAEISIETNANNSDSTSKITPFTIQKCKENIKVTLTAPPIHDEKEFSKWVIDGVQHTSKREITITMCRNRKLKAFY